jgi:hypothetical protein
MMEKQRTRVAQRLAYINETGSYPWEKLTFSALGIEISRSCGVKFAQHVQRVDAALAARPVIDLVAMVEGILFRRAA